MLTDADIEHAPDSLATLVSIAEAGPYDLASFMVKLHCETPPEKLLIPAFVFFFFKLYPPAWIANPRRGAAGAAGGCILVRPAALEQAGGIQAIRQEVIDDCALAATSSSLLVISFFSCGIASLASGPKAPSDSQALALTFQNSSRRR